MTAPVRVLFVCTANTCRSPFMEVYARSAFGTDVAVSSAGTHATAGLPMSAEMDAELAARGLTSHGFLSRPLSADVLDEADLVLTAEDAQRRFVVAHYPAAADKVMTIGRAAGYDEDVTDPFGRGPDAAASAAARLAAMLDSLLPGFVHTTPSEEAPTHG